MAPQTLSEKDVKLIETKPLLALIKYQQIAIVGLIGVIGFMFFLGRSDLKEKDAKYDAKDAENKLLSQKTVEALEKRAQDAQYFNQVMSTINESRNNHTDNSTNSSPNIKGK